MSRTSPQQKTRHIFIQLPLMQEAIAILALGHSQAEELTQLALSYGYQQVTVFLDEEALVTPLEKREGYQALMQAIRERNIIVIFLLDIAGFFADASQEELDSFIHLGMSRGIFVVTPQGVFSFSHLTLIVEFRTIATKFAALTSART